MKKSKNPYLNFYCFFLLLLLLLNILFFYNQKLFLEDGFFENLQFFILLLTSILSLVLSFKLKTYQIFFVFASIGFLFCSLEELSYLQRFYNYKTPAFFISYNGAKEVNLHNIGDGHLEFILSIIILLWSLLPQIKKFYKYVIHLKTFIKFPDETHSGLFIIWFIYAQLTYGFIQYSYPLYPEIQETILYLLFCSFLIKNIKN